MYCNKRKHRAFQLTYVRAESVAALDFIRAFQLSDMMEQKMNTGHFSYRMFVKRALQLWISSVDSSYRMCRNKKEYHAFQLLSYAREESIAAPNFIRAFEISYVM